MRSVKFFGLKYQIRAWICTGLCLTWKLVAFWHGRDLKSALSCGFHPRCLLLSWVFRVCSGAHTWALLRHSSKQRPSAASAAVGSTPHRTVPMFTHDYLFRLPPLLLPKHTHGSPWWSRAHGVYINLNAKISLHGLMHSHFIVQLNLTCLCDIIHSFHQRQGYFCT